MTQLSSSQKARRCYRCGWYGHIARFCQYPQRASPPQQALQQHVSAETRAQNYDQSRQSPPLWPREPQRTNKNKRVNPFALPLSPTSRDWPPNEPHRNTYNPGKTPNSQAYLLGDLPTPESLTFPATTSPPSPVDQVDCGGQATILGGQGEIQRLSDEDDVDLWALDFPAASVPYVVPTFPALQVAEPLAASMEITGALGPLRNAHDLLSGVAVSKYFPGLNVGLYYLNIGETREWGGFCHDPVFSFIDTNSCIICFADLDRSPKPTTDVGDSEESAKDSKFGICCLLDDQVSFSVGNGLSEEQEARLAALGVSGAAKPVYQDTSPVEPHSPTASSQELPPWRRNEDSRYSRYFPGPRVGAY